MYVCIYIYIYIYTNKLNIQCWGARLLQGADFPARATTNKLPVDIDQ